MATTPNYSVNYDDKRFAEVTADKKAAMSEVESTYGGMINNADKYYQKQINAVQDYADKQAEIQNQKTDFAIEQIEQQKEQAKQDYTKEQSGAYVDWQKQSNQYGANAEQMAAQGMQNTGYSESSQVSMYNTYQNRVATAREVYNRAVLNYDNAIKDARLQNNAALAEIAFNSLQQQLELSLAGFQYKNSLITAQFDKKMAVDETYRNRWQDVLNQINTENALAENVRQFGVQQNFKEKEYEEGVRQFNEELAEQKRQFDEKMKEEKRQFGLTQQQNVPIVPIDYNGNRGASNENSSKNRSKTTKRSYFSDGTSAPLDAVYFVRDLIAAGKSKKEIKAEINKAVKGNQLTTNDAKALIKQFT